MGKSLRAMHWNESKHPRDDRGRFSRTPGGRWATKAVKRFEGGFGDTSMAQPGGDPRDRGRLQTGPGGLINLGAISKASRERFPAPEPQAPTRPAGGSVEPSALKSGDRIKHLGAELEVTGEPRKGRQAGRTVHRVPVRRIADGKTGPVTLSGPVERVEAITAPQGRTPGGMVDKPSVPVKAGGVTTEQPTPAPKRFQTFAERMAGDMLKSDLRAARLVSDERYAEARAREAERARQVAEAAANDTRTEREKLNDLLREQRAVRDINMRRGAVDPKREARIRAAENRLAELNAEDRKAKAKEFGKGDKVKTLLGEFEVTGKDKEGYLRVVRPDGRKGRVDPNDVESVTKAEAPSAGEGFLAETKAALADVDPRKDGGWNLPDKPPPGTKLAVTRTGKIKVPEATRQERRELNAPTTPEAPTATLPQTESTPAYDKLLSTDGPAAMQNKTMRGVVEQMEAHGWQLKGQERRMDLTTWEAPDGRTLAIMGITSKKPAIWSSEHPNAIGTRELNFKAAMAHVVTPTPPAESGKPNVYGAFERLGFGKLNERDHTMRPLERVGRDLQKAVGGSYTYGGEIPPEVVRKAQADLRSAAENDRKIADQRAEYNRGFMSGDGEDENSRLLRQRASQFEAVADELGNMHARREASLLETERRKNAPLDIRPGRSALTPKPAKRAGRSPGDASAGRTPTDRAVAAKGLPPGHGLFEVERDSADEPKFELRDAEGRVVMTVRGNVSYYVDRKVPGQRIVASRTERQGFHAQLSRDVAERFNISYRGRSSGTVATRKEAIDQLLRMLAREGYPGKA